MRITLLILSCCLCSFQLLAAPPVIREEVRASVRNRVDYGYTPGIVVGMANAEGRTYYAYGVGDLQTRQPVNEETLFEIGSVTKVFTTTLLAAMVQSNEVTLNAPLQEFLPDGVTAPERNSIPITLLHLATHSSGLPYVPTLLPSPGIIHLPISNLRIFTNC